MDGGGGPLEGLLGGAGGGIFGRPPLDWLPAWSYNGAVARAMEAWDRERAGSTAPMMCLSGPSVLWMHWANALTWTFFLLYPLYAQHFCHCSESTTFARCNSIAMWLPFLPVLALTLVVEHKALSYMLAIYVQVEGRHFKLLGFDFRHWPFEVWRVWMLMQSTVSHLSIVSNGQLLIRSWMTEYGVCSRSLLDLWTRTIDQSYFSLLLPKHFVSWALALWCLMLLQPLVGLLRTVPVGPPAEMRDDPGEEQEQAEREHSRFLQCQGGSGVDPQVFRVDYTAQVSRAKQYEYRSLMNARQNHGTAAYVLALVTRMSAITSPYFGYAMARIEMHEAGDVQSAQYGARVMNHLYDAITNKLFDFLLVGIFENLFSLHLQISWLALDHAAHHAHGLEDLPTLFSLFLNFGSLAMKTTSVLDIMDIQRKFRSKWEEITSWGLITEYLVSRQRIMDSLFLFFWGTMLLYVLLLLMALAKLIALFECPLGLFNLWAGCVK